MIDTVRIERLRGIHFGQVDGLAGLSVLVGANGCGKSTILDALHLAAHQNPHMALHAICGGQAERLAWDRGWSGRAQVQLWWRGADRTVRLHERNTVRPWPTIALVDGPVPVQDLVRWAAPDGADSPLVGFHARAAALGWGRAMDEMVRTAIPGCTGLEVRIEDGGPVLGAVSPDAFMPVSAFGAGLQAMAGLAMCLAAAEPPALVLADGPDAHVHRDSLPFLADAVHAAVGRGVQVVMTTQRLDTLDSIRCAFDATPDAFAVFQLARSEGGGLAVSRSPGEDAIFARSTAVDSDLR